MDRDRDARVASEVLRTPPAHAFSPKERAALIASIEAQTGDVCGEPGKAAQWLTRLKRLRENRTPLEAIEADRAVQMVPTILGRIEYGVFS